MDPVDVSLYPVFKEHVSGLIRDLDAIYYDDRFSEAAKADHFHRIMQKYDMV